MENLLKQPRNFTNKTEDLINAVNKLNNSSKLESLDLLIELIKKVPVKQPVKIVQL